jgi:hypothetical protein
MKRDLPVTERALGSLDHPNNIKIGKGRVIWANATTDTSGIRHAAGWVLPGGARTDSSVVAHAVAMNIDAHAAQA